MAERHYTTCKITERIILFIRIGFYTFYMPYLEKRYGLKELFGKLSKHKRLIPCSRNIIKSYVHVWIRIKNLFSTQHCWNRTLLLYKFLKSAGCDVIIYVGIRKDSIGSTSITGHSWITVDNFVFDDRTEVENEYYITFRYP